MKSSESEGQLELPFARSERLLGRRLEERLNRAVSLAITENSTVMLSARMRGGILCVRLHRMFLRADDCVIDEIVSYLKTGKSGMPRFRKFVRANRGELEGRPPKRITAKPQGKYYDLRELYEAVNREYFAGSVDAAITWGTRSPRFSVRKRTLGSYSARTNTIRINPILDRKSVPRIVVAFIVYHEMLHAALGTPLRGARRSVHSREFRRRERLFKGYAKARAWERSRC